MPLILSAARTQVLDLLDDPNGLRFNKAGDFAKVDRALQAAVSSCVEEAVSAGLDQFDEETTATTSSTTGLATLSVIAARIRSVQVDAGGSYWNVRQADRPQRLSKDLTARNLVIGFVRDWRLPTTTTHAIVGVGATAGPSWHAFDDWICAEAARRLGIIDNDKRDGLMQLCASARAACLSRENNNNGRPLADPECDDWSQSLGYIWGPSSTAPTLQLVNTMGAW